MLLIQGFLLSVVAFTAEVHARPRKACHHKSHAISHSQADGYLHPSKGASYSTSKHYDEENYTYTSVATISKSYHHDWYGSDKSYLPSTYSPDSAVPTSVPSTTTVLSEAAASSSAKVSSSHERSATSSLSFSTLATSSSQTVSELLSSSKSTVTSTGSSSSMASSSTSLSSSIYSLDLSSSFSVSATTVSSSASSTSSSDSSSLESSSSASSSASSFVSETSASSVSSSASSSSFEASTTSFVSTSSTASSSTSSIISSTSSGAPPPPPCPTERVYRLTSGDNNYANVERRFAVPPFRAIRSGVRDNQGRPDPLAGANVNFVVDDNGLCRLAAFDQPGLLSYMLETDSQTSEFSAFIHFGPEGEYPEYNPRPLTCTLLVNNELSCSIVGGDDRSVIAVTPYLTINTPEYAANFPAATVVAVDVSTFPCPDTGTYRMQATQQSGTVTYPGIQVSFQGSSPVARIRLTNGAQLADGAIFSFLRQANGLCRLTTPALEPLGILGAASTGTTDANTNPNAIDVYLVAPEGSTALPAYCSFNADTGSQLVCRSGQSYRNALVGGEFYALSDPSNVPMDPVQIVMIPT